MKHVLALFMTGIACLFGIGGPKVNAFQDERAQEHQATAKFSTANPTIDQFVLDMGDGKIACRAPNAEEADFLAQQSSRVDAHPTLPIPVLSLAQKEVGLQIVLRATQQMERFPEAKAAFLRAAAIWQDRIQNPITVVIDVDFGPTRFGEPYGPQILGWTLPQDVTSNVYGAVRSSLIANASTEQERQIFSSLPAVAIPTDIGSTTSIRAPSANRRALGLLDAVADPEGRERNLGRPPSIGLNSNAGFDFDPSDGIDSNKVDFEAVVVHEIGHALGFISSATHKQVDKNVPISVSVWDLFRLRLGVSQDSFSTAQRILTAGGEQVFSVAGIEVPLSTGSTNLGGDGRGEWHWKDDTFTGRYIGIMDPGLPPGRRSVMTAYDLMAIKMMGYALRLGFEIVPEITHLSGRINGETLAMTGLAVNPASNAITAQLALLDSSGTSLVEYPPVPFSPGESAIADFSLDFVGINLWRAAAQASLTFVDQAGNRSAPITAGILKGDGGGPNLVSLSYDRLVLKVKAKRLSEPFSLEVNGEVVSISNVTFKGSKKVVVGATPADLHLRNGPNRVRVISNGLRSNAIVLDLPE